MIMKVYLLVIAFFTTSLVTSLASANIAQLKQGVKYYQQGNYVAAAITFHQISNGNSMKDDLLDQANYYLGLSLYNLKLYQASSYPMVKVIRSNSKKYKSKAMEKLIEISNRLGDQHILDYVMSKMQISDLERLAVDVYYFKLASVSYDKGLLDQSIGYLKKSIEKNPNNESSLNLLGLANLKKNETQPAIDAYQKLLSLYAKKPNYNTKKGYTVLNLARAYYQAKSFDDAAEYYRGISKDNSAYRESLTELGWTYLQIGKVKSALSVIQTLHTPYYENYFEPESLVLRAILLNYLCQFDEAEKAVKAFNDNYENTLEVLNNWSSQTITVADAIAEINFATEILKSEGPSATAAMNNYRGKIPFKVTRSVLKDYRMKGLYDTYLLVRDEQKNAKKYFGGQNTLLNPFLDKIYAGRLNYFKSQLATKYNQVISSLEKNITYYNQQIKFVNYEILEAKKSQLRLKIANNEKTSAAEEQNRNFYIKNGYRYWPFQGEFWIDEIGNYQYLGENRCEQE
jgi:Flp pilus assembly protein TadD